MCAKSVKEEFEEEVCRTKEEIEQQRQLVDAVFVKPADGLHREGLITSCHEMFRLFLI